MGSVGANKNTLSSDTAVAVDNYLEGSGRLNNKQANEILSKSTMTKDTLYRVEDSEWLANKLKVGQDFTFNEAVKSFTSTQSGIDTVVAEGDDAGMYENTVAIYQTEGNTKSFDVSGMSRNHAEEGEHLVGGTFTVVSKEKGPKIRGYNTVIIKIRQKKGK